MVTSEREMVRKQSEPKAMAEERFTSLQPTYEDSVPDDDELDWESESAS
jgi:hypothetical protein